MRDLLTFAFPKYWWQIEKAKRLHQTDTAVESDSMTRKISYHDIPDPPSSLFKEQHVEDDFIGKLQPLKYEYRPYITDRARLEKNFRQKFEEPNRIRLTAGEFARLLNEIVTPVVFAASQLLRQINAFTRDDATPLNYTLVNIKEWCQNTFELIRELRNTTFTYVET